MPQDREQIIYEKAAMLDQSALDELMHESKSQEAADINNSGVEAQVGYLMECFPLPQLEQTINELLAAEKAAKDGADSDS